MTEALQKKGSNDMKKLGKMELVKEAREFGECYLGNLSFDVIKDTKSWNRFLSKNEISDCYLYCDDNNDWYIISK